MKKIAFSLLIWLLTLSSASLAAQITSVRHSTSFEKVRVVLAVDVPVNYTVVDKGLSFAVSFPDTSLAKDYESYRVYDGMLKDFSFKQSGSDLILFIETSYPVERKIFYLKEPSRIVIDLPRAEVTGEARPSEISEQKSPEGWFTKAEPVTDGVSLLRINQESGSKITRSYALLVDPRSVDIMPVISVPEIKGGDGKSVFGSLFDWLGGEDDKEPYSHFSKRTVYSFSKLMGAAAAVNGSFFFGSGTPVGTLIINRQVISSPLYNRTALIINGDGTASIDPVKMDGYLKLENGETLGFSAVNQPAGKDQIIVYTPDYQSTDPSGSSVNAVIVDGKVKEINYGETAIPRNGFVVSANGPAGEVLRERLKKGSEVKWFFMASPPLDRMRHVIAGGPRLLYNGQYSVNSKEEKFKNDVANSRAARTAVGITKNGQMIFVVVEKNDGEGGATLDELANLLLKLGAYNAMNLDGGGSSTMVVNGKTLNSGAGRPVSNAIVVRAR